MIMLLVVRVFVIQKHYKSTFEGKSIKFVSFPITVFLGADHAFAASIFQFIVQIAEDQSTAPPPQIQDLPQVLEPILD
jgi:hypothetical protein